MFALRKSCRVWTPLRQVRAFSNVPNFTMRVLRGDPRISDQLSKLREQCEQRERNSVDNSDKISEILKAIRENIPKMDQSQLSQAALYLNSFRIQDTELWNEIANYFTKLQSDSKTPFTSDEFVTLSHGLISSGFASEQIIDAIDDLLKANQAARHDAFSASNLAMIIDLLAKIRVMASEHEALSERLLQIWNDALSFASEKIQDMTYGSLEVFARGLLIGSEHTETYWQKVERRLNELSFYGLAPEAVASFPFLFSHTNSVSEEMWKNLQSAFSILKSDISPTQYWGGLSGFIRGLHASNEAFIREVLEAGKDKLNLTASGIERLVGVYEGLTSKSIAQTLPIMSMLEEKLMDSLSNLHPVFCTAILNAMKGNGTLTPERTEKILDAIKQKVPTATTPEKTLIYHTLKDAGHLTGELQSLLTNDNLSS
eukprot:TRINITY_DN4094_c0_g1_i4.p1 TRINITY_DN4094_c0_g1~~TRINITY_DN4094_c0_g1_i4.p1  ORF type:complete len:429 (-),score=64.07 TRINITY_DN4094_c0_g1_i4:169-1455(-)